MILCTLPIYGACSLGCWMKVMFEFSKANEVSARLLLIFEIGGEFCQCWAVYTSTPNLPIHKKRCWPRCRWLAWGRIHPHNVWQRCPQKEILRGGPSQLKGTSCASATENLFFQVTGSTIVWLTIELQPLCKFTVSFGTAAIAALVLWNCRVGCFPHRKIAIFLLLPGPYYFKRKTSLFYKVLFPACLGETGLLLRKKKKMVTRLLVKQLSERLVILFLLLKYPLIHLAGFLAFL